MLELIGQGQGRLTRTVLKAGDAAGDGAPASDLEVEPGDAATSIGAPVFLNDRVIAMIAARTGGAGRKLVSIEALDDLLQSEALAALH